MSCLSCSNTNVPENLCDELITAWVYLWTFRWHFLALQAISHVLFFSTFNYHVCIWEQIWLNRGFGFFSLCCTIYSNYLFLPSSFMNVQCMAATRPTHVF